MAKRVTQGNDRRIRCLQLTQHGKRIMQLREDSRVLRVSAVLRHLTPKSREEVLATLADLDPARASRPENKTDITSISTTR